MRITGKCKGTVEWKGEEVEFTASVSCDWYHEDGCMYRRNGDPGDPPYDEYDNLTYESTDECAAEDYDENATEINNLIKDFIETDVDPDDCDWDESNSYEDYYCQDQDPEDREEEMEARLNG